MPRAGEGLLFLPAGARGPAFLLTENFFVIKAYNTSDAYALAVGHLGDRILGGAPIRGAWPKAETMLGRNERVEVQKRLSERGPYDGDTDGRSASRPATRCADSSSTAGSSPTATPTRPC